MKFFVSVLLLVLCFCTVAGDPPPAWPPPSYVMERQWQNIMDYGAKGDGTTNDRAAIQAALDAVPDSGGCVFVPHSDSGFLINDSTLIIKAYTTLLGVGRGSKILLDPSVEPFTMIINLHGDSSSPHDTGIVIDGIYWDGGRDYIVYDSTDSASIIEIRHAHKCVIRNCFFTRSDKDGIGLRQSSDCKILNNTFWEMGEEGVVVSRPIAKRNIVSGNHFIMRDSSYKGLSGLYAGGIPAAILLNANNVTISNNVFRYGGGGIDMDQQTVAPLEVDTAYNIIITNNQFVSIQGNNCISPQRPYSITISDNTFFDCDGVGIFCWGPGDWTQGQGGADTTTHDMIITNNQFLNHHKVCIHAGSGHGYQITKNVFSDIDTTAIICAGDRSVITENRITEVASGYGIHVTAQKHSIISNNQISYVGGSGLRVETFAGLDEYLSINGNTIAYCALGIDLVNVDMSTVIGNVCVDNDSAGIYAANCYHNIVALNVCTSSPDSTQDYGILFAASANLNMVHSNILGGNTVSAISGMDGNLEYGNRLDTAGVLKFSFHGNVGIGEINPQVSLVIDTINPRIFLNAMDTGGIAAGDCQIRFDSAGSLGWSLVFNCQSSSDFWIRNHVLASNLFRVAHSNGAITFNEAYTFPTADGTAGYVLETNGAGEVTWQPNDTGAGAGGEANTISDTGTYNETEGFGVAGGKTGVSLKVKGLIEGSNITIAKSGDSGLIITGAAGGGGLWAFRDSTTIVYVNDSTGDTNVFIQDTTGFRGLRVSGIMTDTLTVNNYMKVGFIYGDEVGSYKIRMYDSVSFHRRPFYSGVTHVHYSDSEFITLNQVQKIAGDSAAGETNTLGDTGTFNGTEGFGLAGGKTGTVLKVKGLIEGSNITIAASGDSGYTITGSAGGSAVEILESNVSKDDPLVILNLMSGFDVIVANETSYVTFDFTEDKVNLTPGAETEVTGILGVENGGTETNTLTDGGILLGSGTGAITALGEAANGQIPIGDGTTDPVLNEIDGTANEVTVTNGAGTITLSLPNDAGTDISVDLEEETHASEHEDTGGDEIAVTAGMMNTGTGASSSTYWRGDNTWVTPSGGVWIASNDTMFLIDADGDTLAAFWDDDAGNVWWQVGTEDQTLRLLVDTIGIGGDVISEFARYGLVVTANGLEVDTANAVADAETKTVTGNAVFDFCETTKNYALNSELHTRSHAMTSGSDHTATAWRAFYAAAAGAVTELALGADGTYLKSNGASSAPTWATPSGSAVWVISNDTAFLVDDDGDTLAAFWDDDAGNVRWQVGTEDQTLHLFADTVGIGKANPEELLHLFGNNATLKLEDDSENDATINVGNSQLCIQIDPDNLIASSDICFDIDGAEVARFHASTNFGIGTLSPPERLSVVGNIATGDTAAGDVDVFHYFSRDGDYLAAYLKIDDGLGRFEFNLPLDVTGNITVSGTVDTVDVGALAAKVHKEDMKRYMFNLADPDALYATDHEWCIDPLTGQAITIDSFRVTLDADPTTELTFSLKFADALIGFANAVVIDDTATVAGVTTVTGGFGDATVPAGKCIYWLFDADPDDAITQASVKIYYSID